MNIFIEEIHRLYFRQRYDDLVVFRPLLNFFANPGVYVQDEFIVTHVRILRQCLFEAPLYECPKIVYIDLDSLGLLFSMTTTPQDHANGSNGVRRIEYLAQRPDVHLAILHAYQYRSLVRGAERCTGTSQEGRPFP